MVMSSTVVRIAVVLLGAGAWSWWDERRSHAPQADDRAATFAGRLVGKILAMVVLLAVALLLTAFHVPGATIVAMIALVAIIALEYVGPWVGLAKHDRHRRRRD